MTSSVIPLKDSRRHRRGNRTLRMPKAAWLAICDRSGRNDPRAVARDICRLKEHHFYEYSEAVYRALFAPRMNPSMVLHNLIHGEHWLSTPTTQRKKYSHAIRSILTMMKTNRTRLRCFLLPNQSTSMIPG